MAMDQMKMLMKLKKAQSELSKELVEVEAGDGAVVVQINGELKVKSLNDLPEIASQLSRGNEQLYKQKINELFRGKAVISMVPFAFSVLVMGSFVALASRLWTQYRFNCGVGNEKHNKKSIS
jgi:hypothetical protein